MDKFGKIRRHHWKGRLKISKISKFESDLLKTNKDIAPQSREILQTFVWWVAQTPTSVDFRDFPAHLSSLKTYHIQILSTLVSYEELGAGFEPIRNGDIFWMKNNTENSVA